MDINFPQLENKILEFWKKNKIFEKSIEGRKKARDFVFYEGPPTANAKPGIHHILTRVFKDIICRYKTMRGFKVLRKAGWDTHGLPVELEIEKKLGLKNKKDIEKYGIVEFNRKCKESVWFYKQDWEKLTERIGFWLDLKNPYITYETEYIETVWRILKEIHKKGLLYQGYKVVPYCPRCGTSLSSHELAQGYDRIKEPSIYVKFRILNPGFKNTSFLVWTTTPWTLPGNVAIAANPEIIYAKVNIGGEYLILAKERLKVLGKDVEIIQELKGKDIIGLKYQAVFDFYSPDYEKEKIWEVIPADFVSLEEGTGLVHIAPAFGEEDMNLIKITNSKSQIPNKQFPILLTVDEEGKFTLDVKKWAGMFVKEADPLIIEDLKNQNILFKEELYEHDYPFCWRCHSPLLYYAKQSWFINMQRVKDNLIENNQKINWVPSYLKEGRFGEWLREIKDWAISRERYWGTPLPVWRCKKCGGLELIGSRKDLVSQKFSTNKYYIIRHGQTIYQTEKKEFTYPWPEKTPVLLTEKGEGQIKKSSKELKNKGIDLIYSSDTPRTRQTSEILAKELGVKIIFDKRLRDINLGIYQGGNKKEEFYRNFPIEVESMYNKKPPKGENWGETRKRMMDCLDDIDKKYQNKTILIVSHGDPLWLLEGTLEGISDEKLLERKIKHSYVKTGEWRKIDYKKIPLEEKGAFDFHRPYIDEVKFYCPKCGNLMERVPEVIDCWFDSGSMPFSQNHWSFNEKSQKIKAPELFPADYISEAIDQTRGWFYTLLAISTLLGFESPYKNVISLGHVLDEKGEKMSKSKGNVVDPWYIIDKYGIDAARWYFYTMNQPGDPKLFSEKDIEGSLKKFILTFFNSFLFFKTYKAKSGNKKILPQNALDKWVISRLNGLIDEVSKRLDNYDVTGAAREIEDFTINSLSLWYIRRSRRKFQKAEKKEELKMASRVLEFVILTLSKLTAPFTPFLSDYIYQNLKSKTFRIKSVHLDDWPRAQKKLIDKNLEEKMEKVREIVAKALAERAKAGIKVRQPLASLQIPNKSQIPNELLNLIEDEVNVKKITFGKALKLDTKITPELKEEGLIREIIRNVQEMRKAANLKPKDRISVNYFGGEDLNKALDKNQKFILKEANIKSLLQKKKEKESFAAEKIITADQQEMWLGIKKI